jgi:hypothetical protein
MAPCKIAGLSYMNRITLYIIIALLTFLVGIRLTDQWEGSNIHAKGIHALIKELPCAAG